MDVVLQADGRELHDVVQEGQLGLRVVSADHLLADDGEPVYLAETQDGHDDLRLERLEGFGEGRSPDHVLEHRKGNGRRRQIEEEPVRLELIYGKGRFGLRHILVMDDIGSLGGVLGFEEKRKGGRDESIVQDPGYRFDYHEDAALLGDVLACLDDLPQAVVVFLQFLDEVQYSRLTEDVIMLENEA